MERYRNLSGDSGVSGFEIGSDSVTVQFTSGDTYLYTYRSAGQRNIERMKTLALAGKGLGTFINTYVRKMYARKLR